jgi:Tol biopolymer transport system component
MGRLRVKPAARRRARAGLGIVTVVGVLGGVLMGAAASFPTGDPEPEAASAPATSPNRTTRVSVAGAAVAANGPSSSSAISADGRYVAFVSASTNLVPGDTNRVPDVFLRDRARNRTVRVSVGARGVQANGPSAGVTMSADGRWIAYSSGASNLVPADTNRMTDVFLYDRDKRRTTRVSVSKKGLQANGGSVAPALSPDGDWIAFHSGASNLVAGDTNRVLDVFLHGRKDGTTRRVSVGRDGTQADGASINAAVGAGGRFVAFQSGARNLIGKDTNKVNDVFVRDTVRKTTRRVSTAGAHRAQFAVGSGAPAISDDGRFVAFHTSLLPAAGGRPRDKAYGQVYLHDRATGRTRLVSSPIRGGFATATNSAPSISADGRRVAYYAVSAAAAGVPAASELLVRDIRSGKVVRIGVTLTGARARGGTLPGTISRDGRHVVFEAAAWDLVAGDLNGVADTFVRDLKDFGADAIPS